MLRILNANSTTYYANTIKKGDGNQEKRKKLIPTLQNLLSIKNAATEINIAKITQKIPFNVDLLVDIAETKSDLLASIKLLKGRLDQEESLLLKNRLYYNNTLHRLKNKLIATLSQCNRNILRINNKIPRSENKIALSSSTPITQEYDGYITDTLSGGRMTMNNCLVHTREMANQAKTQFEAQTSQLHYTFTTTIKETQQSIGEINSQITALNTVLEQQQSSAEDALRHVNSNHSHNNAIKNLKLMLREIKKQEKYNHNATTVLNTSPLPSATGERVTAASDMDIAGITAIIRKNQFINSASRQNRQPVTYTLIKKDNEAMLISLTQNLGSDVISNEFKHDIIQILATLKATASETLPDIEVRNKLNDILSVLDSASTMTPALISEGQYVALAQKLLLAYNAQEPTRLALFNQVQEILQPTSPVSMLSSEKINTLIRYLTTGGLQDN
ncbi:hypothetical protein [Candidatus Symbiopectobacterium sp. NZEC135]|uniref:hypothetical protein n=1 Tax=Candidatus Symbiopectobacterium sp. NZEC135 TaxID=2820471 RepID=UPI0022266B4C|nr:hypothetical protein [Candidatus Symbiopectobacterium sp. NZEC135]MCW2481825.1 hypothetical protein [Candidatus Symbiopectobacterium sp. NZEC135]